MTRVDLHIHTTASDGQLTSEHVIQLAAQYHLNTVAITDHDTTAGIFPAQEAARGVLEVIPGIEIGARHDLAQVDILGYFIDIQHSGLQQRLATFRQDRLRRGQRTVERLAQLGLPVAWSRVVALAGGDSVGRPHIARAMVEAGYVQSVKEAFDRYLDSSQPAYIPRQTLTPQEAVDLIHAAGGVAVLAHPVFVADLPAVVDQLVAAGLDGIEVSYPEHTPEFEAQVREMALRHDLVMTGGSDFHGLNMPGKAMIGAALAPAGAVEALRERAAGYRSPSSA